MFLHDCCLDTIGVAFVEILNQTISFHLGHELVSVLDEVEGSQDGYCERIEDIKE